MKYVGIDLHKRIIAICVVSPSRKVLERKTLYCNDPAQIREYFQSLGEFQAVIEATAAYDWLAELLDPLAQRVVLAHPGKMRIIAESKRKSDRIDARILAEFLALEIIPQAHRPTPRQRELRTLVRQRQWLKQRRTSLRCQVRSLLARYNLDRKDLFTPQGRQYLEEVKVSDSDRFCLDQMLFLLAALECQLTEYKKKLGELAKRGSAKEQKARRLLLSAPGIGEVTSAIVLAELGSDVRRFGSQKDVAAYAGLAPGRRESAGKARDLPITKQGSRLLRWGMIQSAWVAIRHDQKWRAVHEQLTKRRGKKRAIVAVARRLLCVVAAILRSEQPYDQGYDRRMGQQRAKQKARADAALAKLAT